MGKWIIKVKTERCKFKSIPNTLSNIQYLIKTQKQIHDWKEKVKERMIEAVICRIAMHPENLYVHTLTFKELDYRDALLITLYFVVLGISISKIRPIG